MDFTYKIKVFKTKYLARLVYACIWNSILQETRKAIECKISTYSTYLLHFNRSNCNPGWIHFRIDTHLKSSFLSRYGQRSESRSSVTVECWFTSLTTFLESFCSWALV